MGNVGSTDSNVYRVYAIDYKGAEPTLLGTTLSRSDAKFVIKCHKMNRFSYSKRKFRIEKGPWNVK